MKEWNYGGEADITIGEVRISKTAKIILIILLVLLTIATGLSLYFRHYIYDYIANPEIMLSDSEINLEVHTDFNAEDYIINLGAGYEYTVENIDSIDINKLGTYEVVYKSHNSVKSKEAILTVNVVDTTPPVITLTKDVVMLTRGEETNKFRPMEYLESVEDNYTKSEKIKLDVEDTFDFTQDEIKVIFTAEDENHNKSSKSLTLAVFDSFEEMEKEKLRKEQEEREKKEQEEKKTETETTTEREKQTTREQYTTTYTPTETEYVPPATEATTTEYIPPETEAPITEAPQQQAYISGVHDISVPVESDFSSMVNQLISGVQGSGFVSCDYSNVNLQVPGTYPVYWSSDDGASAVSYVTVYE